jgi:exonuclease VII small subunit
MNEVPTLLVGLGGIGSRIVDQVYGMIPGDRRSRIAAHIFDTNVNDISNLKNLNKDWRTQTSKDLTVEQYLINLREAESYVKDWFPFEERELRRKSLTEGAGQVRVVSRLAYRAAMEEGKLDNLHKQITSIFRETGESEVKSARVMIISSLVGGTGGGIFLQTAMYLRELIKNNYKRTNVLIRGAFLLPDILALTGTIPKGEIESIRANAYACLKELNAITQNTTAYARNIDRVEIELEYKPNQRDSAGRLNHVVMWDQLPYDFCFLYDFENTARNNLQYFENYINQVGRCIYLELFSPIAEDKFSRQDNQILALVENEGLSRYCGAGVASLVYPYRDNIDYFALKWAGESLSNDWLKIDDDFDREYRQYERDLQNGITRQEPKIAERYVWLLDNLAGDESPQPFFRAVHRSAHTIGKKNEIEDPKSHLFLSAVEQEIDRIIDSDDRLSQFQYDCEIDENRLKDKDRILNEVLKVEDALITFENELNKFVKESRNFISNQIYLRDCEAQRFIEGKDYQLNTWILRKSEPVHPVAVRYILYQIYTILEGRTQQLNSENSQLERSIQHYKKAYDLPDSEEIVEDAQERIRLALKQGFLGKLYKDELKEFAEEYYEKASRHRKNLINYKRQKLQELVYTDLKKAVARMLADWERYFRNLRNIRNNLQQDVNRLAVHHERSGDPTIRYILASQEMKEALWKENRRFMQSSLLPVDISEQIYLGQYRRFCHQYRKDRFEEEPLERVESMFRKDVVGFCRRELLKMESLDINCIEAMRREAELQQIPGSRLDSHIEELIKSLDRLARPFVPETVHANRIDAWGAHPDCIHELSNQQRNELFGTGLIGDASFLPYEIIRYKSNYNMKVNDFSKFSSGDPGRGVEPGEYFIAYANRINQLTTRGNTVTPHLDKRWHVPAFLPDLNPQKAKEDETKVDRALIVGIMMGYLKNDENYGAPTWVFFEGSNSRLVRIGDKLADKYTHSLHKALMHNPVIVDKVMQLYLKRREEDKGDFQDKIAQHQFHKQALHVYYYPIKKEINILDLLLRYADDARGDEKLPQKEEVLLNALLEEIFSYFLFVYGSHKEGQANTEAKKFVQALMEGSEFYSGADKRSSRFQVWENIIQNKLRSTR